MPIKKTSHPASLAGAGGGVVIPTLQTGLTFDEGDALLTYQLQNNDASNPAALDLAFSGSVLEAPPGSFDNGTPGSPSYVLEGGETRNITLRRGSGAPGAGDSAADCTISALLADGNIATSVVSVQPPIFAALVGALATPLHEFRFKDGTFANTGSRSGIVSAATPTNASAQASSSLTGLEGFATLSGISSRVTLQDASNFVDFRLGQPRSLIWVLNQPGASVDSGRLVATYLGRSLSPNGWGGFIEIDGASHGRFKVSVPANAGGSQVATSLQSSSAFTVASTARSDAGGSPSSMAKVQGLKLLVMTYDGTTGNDEAVRLRYKSSGEAAGHTILRPDSGAGTYYDFAVRSGVGSVTVPIFGGSASENSSSDHDYCYFGIIDSEVGDADFDSLAAALGL